MNTVRLLKTEEYDEEMGYVIFVSFSKDVDGEIIGEPPEVKVSHGYLEVDFDETKWTHFIDNNLDFMFIDADPVNFPPLNSQEQ